MSSALIRLAQLYQGDMPNGVALSEASLEELVQGINSGLARTPAGSLPMARGTVRWSDQDPRVHYPWRIHTVYLHRGVPHTTVARTNTAGQTEVGPAVLDDMTVVE